MSASYKILSLNESGKASYKHASKLFILSGIVIPEKFKIKLDRNIRKLEMRFFDNEEIVFHGRDVFRKEGVFSLFKNSKLEMKFWSEFISIVTTEKSIFSS